MSLKVSHLYKSYDKPIIQDFSYTFEDNHIYAITGPSVLNRKLYPSDDCKLYYPI